MLWTSFETFKPFICDRNRKCLGCGEIIKAGVVCRVKDYTCNEKIRKNIPQRSVIHNLDCWQLWDDAYWQGKSK